MTNLNEHIFNIYVEVDDGIIRQFGVNDYWVSGSDEEKYSFLKNAVESDCKNRKYFPIPNRYELDGQQGYLRYETYIKLSQMGKHHEIFFEMLREYGNPEYPLMCFTPVVDGIISIDGEITIETNTMDIDEIHFHDDQSYLIRYTQDGNLHICDLINDDFFEPIKVLINKSYFANALKLLVSAIDTFAFLEFGDVQGNYIQWVNKYLSTSSLFVTAEELWEFRNSILHMTNYESRKVKKGDVASLTIVIGRIPMNMNSKFKTINFHDFYAETANAVERWQIDVFSDAEKIKLFIERYNSIISDNRINHIRIK